METKFESRIGKIAASEEKMYNFLTDFNNFKQFIPPDKVTDFQSDTDHCKFSISGVGQVGLQIVEKTPYNTVKISGDALANQNFLFWIQLKEVSDADTRVKLTIKADINPMVKLMVSKPMQTFLDKLIDAFEKMQFTA